MSIYDRCLFLTVPVALRDFKQPEVLRALARCVSTNQSGHLLDIEDIDLEILDIKREEADGFEYLMRLEALHKSLTMYLWLTYRYSGIFESQTLAFHVKGLVEEKITEYLDHLSFVPDEGKRVRQRQREMAAKHAEREATYLGPEVVDGATVHEGPGQWSEEPDEEPLLDHVTPEELPAQRTETSASGVIPNGQGGDGGQGHAAEQGS
jgi:ATP-dependent RNA helicase SUPV3L1/SUV3